MSSWKILVIFPFWKRQKNLQILLNLEEDRGQDKISNKKIQNNQLDFFTIQDPISQEIKLELMKIDLDNLTPIEALVILNDL